MEKKQKLYWMEPPNPMPMYWNVYRVEPKYVLNREFLAYVRYPGTPAFSSPFWTYLGCFLAFTDEEAISKAQQGIHSEARSVTT